MRHPAWDAMLADCQTLLERGELLIDRFRSVATAARAKPDSR
jgi:hypothetical protein